MSGLSLPRFPHHLQQKRNNFRPTVLLHTPRPRRHQQWARKMKKTTVLSFTGEAEAAAEEADENVCANCGIAGVDNIKLKECSDCDLVKYCSTNCREDHREQHKHVCKIRADELHDKPLFTQPDGTHEGECPICFLPMPLDPQKSSFMSCCGNTICMGCCYAHIVSNIHDEVKASTCVFCRTPNLDEEERGKRERERIEANDAPTLCFMGTGGYEEGDYDKAVEYWTRAAELGDAEAHYRLGLMYEKGEGVEKDEEKEVYHLEKAAIGGHPYARHNLACSEAGNRRYERAAKHWIISANLGDEASMKALLPCCKGGYITKDEYGATLRTHQAAVDAMKSAQRDAAEKENF